MAGERILIIDDSQEIISFLMAVLRPLRYVVLYAKDGKEGLAKAIYEKPDLVLLDVNLPGMSGIAVLEALYHRSIQIPVIMMTFHGSDSIMGRAMRLGVRDYLTKPFQVEQILASIERVLREERESREQSPLALDPAILALQQQPLLVDRTTFRSIVGTSLSAATSRQAFLSQVTDAALRLTGAEVSAVFFVEAGTTWLKQVVRQGENLQVDVAVTDRYIDTVRRSGKPLQISGAAEPPPFTAQLGIQAHLVLYVPLLLRERAIGVMAVAFCRPDQELSAEPVEWLLMFSDYVALLWENLHYRDALSRSLPLQKVGDVLGIFIRSMMTPLQTLLQKGGGESLHRDIKALAVTLATLKEVISPNSAFYIGKAHLNEIESELENRIKQL